MAFYPFRRQLTDALNALARLDCHDRALPAGIADDTPVQAFPRLKELIRHVHIKDFVPGDPGSGRRWVGTAIGSGQAMVRESLALVKGMEYKGWVSLEVSIAPPLPEAIQAAKVVRDLWAEV